MSSTIAEVVDVNTLAVSVLVVGVLGVAIFKFLTSNKLPKNAFPLAPVGLLESMTKVGNEEAPWFMLDIAKKMGRQSYRLPLPLGPGGAYVVGDWDLARTIQQDPLSEKPRQVYRGFDGMTGRKQSIFTVTNANPYHKIARKGSAQAFSKGEVGRMLDISRGAFLQWREGRLNDFVESGEPFDPALEMNMMTLDVICKAAFEYDRVTTEDYENLSHHLEVALREHTFKQTANPLRRTFGYFIPSVREADHSTAETRAFVTKLRNAYRANPNKSKSKTLIRLIEENDAITESQKNVDMLIFLIGTWVHEFLTIYFPSL